MSTDLAEAPPTGRTPAERRRRLLIATVVGVLVAIALVVGGPFVYAKIIADDAPAPLALPAVTATADPGATAPAEEAVAPGEPLTVDGTWQVATGSLAGYRIDEVLSGQDVTVVGRTEQVSGTVVIAGGMMTAADITVDVASIATDESARDSYFRRALDSTDFPQATFSLTEPVDVTAVADATGPVEVTAPGTLTFHGVSRPVTGTFAVQRAQEGVEVAGTIPVDLADFDLEAPDFGFVKVEPTGTVEMSLRLTQG